MEKTQKPDERERVYSGIALGTLTGIAHSGLLLLIGVLLPPIILQYLDSEGYGRWVLFVSLASYINLFEMGLTTGLAKVWSEGGGQADFSKARAVFRTVFILFVAASLLGMSLSSIVAMKWTSTYSLLPWFVFAAGLSLLGGPFAGILRGLHRTDLVNLANAWSALANAGLVYWLLIDGFGLWALVLGTVLSNSGRFLVFLFWVRRLVPGFNPLEKGTWGSVGELLKLGATEQITSIWVVVLAPTNRAILYGILGASVLAYYDLGSRLVAATVSIPVVMLPSLLPAFSYLLTTNDRKGICDVLTRANKYTNMLGLPFFWFLMIFADPLTAAWLGHPAPAVAIAIRILLIGTFINLITGPYTQALIGMGRPKLCIQKVLASALLGLILPVWLGLQMGLAGFLIGESLAVGVPSLVFLYRFESQEGIVILGEISSYISRMSLHVIPWNILGLLIYTNTSDAVIWQHIWIWGIMFAIILWGSVSGYRLSGLISLGEMRRVWDLLNFKVKRAEETVPLQ